MMNFCTLFDSAYLSRGLVMYDSLKMHTRDFHLYIFAFDSISNKILKELELEFATIISLEEFENSRLLSVKASRTKAEYCWTCTSSVIDYILENYNVPSCTYLDADIFFYASPQILLNELKEDKTVLITEHRFSKIARLIEQKRAGRFCVQFITFFNTKESRKILDKWISQCIEWCYARYENGKFGDQKYLDSWPEEYSNVHILKNPGGGIAPWNARQYDFEKNGNSIAGTTLHSKERFDVVFFHFHFVRLLHSGYSDLGWNRLGNNVVRLFYKPYIQTLIEKENDLEKRFSSYKISCYKPNPVGVRENIKHIYKTFTKFNLIKTQIKNNGLSDRP